MRIGQPDSEHLRLEILGRLFPQSQEYCDGNWLVTRVEIRGGGFRGRFETEIRVDEYAGFLAGLERLEKTPDATAQLKPVEPAIRIDISRKSADGLIASCEVGERAGAGKKLYFKISFDSAELPLLIHELREILREYPLVGKKK